MKFHNARVIILLARMMRNFHRGLYDVGFSTGCLRATAELCLGHGSLHFKNSFWPSLPRALSSWKSPEAHGACTNERTLPRERGLLRSNRAIVLRFKTIRCVFGTDENNFRFALALLNFKKRLMWEKLVKCRETPGLQSPRGPRITAWNNKRER